MGIVSNLVKGGLVTISRVTFSVNYGGGTLNADIYVCPAGKTARIQPQYHAYTSTQVQATLALDVIVGANINLNGPTTVTTPGVQADITGNAGNVALTGQALALFADGNIDLNTNSLLLREGEKLVVTLGFLGFQPGTYQFFYFLEETSL
jgi:hypothetical protein